MLNPFPIQFLALFAYFLLRLTVSVCLMVIAAKQTKSYNDTAYPQLLKFVILAEISIAILLLLGAYTQYAVIGLALLSILAFFFAFKKPQVFNIPATAALLLFGISVTLFITGAGAFAVDLPI